MWRRPVHGLQPQAAGVPYTCRHRPGSDSPNGPSWREHAIWQPVPSRGLGRLQVRAASGACNREHVTQSGFLLTFYAVPHVKMTTNLVSPRPLRQVRQSRN